MKIFYKVLLVDEPDGSILVRYWTDKLSEKELSMDPEETLDVPTKCYTDYALHLWNPQMSEQELHEVIRQQAPIQWFELQEKIKDPTIDTSLDMAQDLVGKVFTYEVSDPNDIKTPHKKKKEIDITELLSK